MLIQSSYQCILTKISLNGIQVLKEKNLHRIIRMKQWPTSFYEWSIITHTLDLISLINFEWVLLFVVQIMLIKGVYDVNVVYFF